MSGIGRIDRWWQRPGTGNWPPGGPDPTVGPVVRVWVLRVRGVASWVLCLLPATPGQRACCGRVGVINHVCAAVDWPLRLLVSIILDTAALTWLSVPYGPLPRSCLGSQNAWSAPVVPENRGRIGAPDADLGYVSLVARCICLVRVRGMSRVHR